MLPQNLDLPLVDGAVQDPLVVFLVLYIFASGTTVLEWTCSVRSPLEPGLDSTGQLCRA
jgi:hypothetical protein